ncbi:MAG: peptidylprolyl isomerase, partial [Candidatus Eisenbacteria bacterium]
PAGTGATQARAFVDQLVEKEAMARAALAEPFTASPPESAQLVAYRQNLERQELYRLLIADSTRVTTADRDSARRQMSAVPGAPTPPPEAIEGEARRLAERRRTDEVETGIRSALAPAWDDSVAALLARGYAAVGDTTLPDLDNPFGAILKDRRPRVAPADTARTLVGFSAGTVTVAGFVRRFALLNPFQSPLPTTAGTVKARAEQFLGQMWFDREVARRGIAARPGVRSALAERREGVALDHWYERHVRGVIDTSETARRAHYTKDPAKFGVQPHAMIHHLVVPARATADSLVAVLLAGTPWDSVCARFSPGAREREACGHAFSIADDTTDSLLVTRLRELAPGGAYVRPEPAGNGFRVIQLIERNGLRIRPFEEVRDLVARDLAALQSEDILTARMAALVAAMPKTINQPALARLRLDP